MRNLIFILFFTLVNSALLSQSDSLRKILEENEKKIDTLNLTVSNIIVTGNRITDPDIILREMSLKKGSRFTLRAFSGDVENIYNLGLFTRADIIPIPGVDREITLNVDVQERWYIMPLPDGGIDDGEWKKIWLGLNLQWDNFRGRNEKLDLGFKIFYNPAVSFGYYVPWIGEKLHLFAGIGGSWQRNRNRSLTAVGRTSGSGTITFEDKNYENIQYRGELKIGRYFGKFFSLFTDYKFHHLRVTEYQPGRTVSDDGVDRYLSFGLGVSYDTRDIYEYATKGFKLLAHYSRSGFIDSEINFGRFIFEEQSFIPVNITDSYYLTAASKFYTSIGIGAVLPVYNHQFLGYGDSYVRGWNKYTYEGDNIITVYNELRIPVLKPRYIKGRDMIVLKHLPVIKNMDLRHGLFFTLIYDIGTVWYKHENLFKQKFISGAGVGINFIAPFGYVLRADWVFRLSKPVVGQIGFGLNAKF